MGVGDQLTIETDPIQKMLRLVPLLAIASASPAASPASSLAACKACSPPTFPPTPQGRPLWLPHCVNGKSLNFCDAVCSGEELSSSNQGSCEGCEAKCSPPCALWINNLSSRTDAKHSAQALRRWIARA